MAHSEVTEGADDLILVSSPGSPFSIEVAGWIPFSEDVAGSKPPELGEIRFELGCSCSEPEHSGKIFFNFLLGLYFKWQGSN